LLIFTFMSKNKYKVIGVMSGTSLDGIDLAVCNFEKHYITESNAWKWSYCIEETETIPYPVLWERKLAEAFGYSQEQLKALNVAYTHYLATTITNFVSLNAIKGIDAVCSHGHTILHQPEKGITLQIGNLPTLSEMIQKRVVCDFRVQDVLLGGQGAPLVPIGDKLLFNTYDCCLNLGGFANASHRVGNKYIAYDICPVNIVLNKYAKQLGKLFDDQGSIASKGKVHLDILDLLNVLGFYHQAPPKSLGIEWVKATVFPLLDQNEMSNEDKLATFTEHIAMQISKVSAQNNSVLVTGGGAYNNHLIQRINHYSNFNLTIPDKKILEYKEALIFGLLGVLKLRGEVNCLSSVTGASKNHSSGIVFDFNE